MRKARKKPVRATGRRRESHAPAGAKPVADAGERDSAAERRLQTLLRELDKTEVAEDDTLESPEADFDSAGPLHRPGDDE